jgi:hypothetical protein
VTCRTRFYGSGGSAVTATLKAVGTALAGLNDPITILYADPGACPGYQQYLNNAITSTVKYWDATGQQLTDNYTESLAQVQATNFIVDKDSSRCRSSGP